MSKSIHLAFLSTVFAAAVCFATVTEAQPGASGPAGGLTRVRGTLTAVSSDRLTVSTRDGKDVSVNISKDTRVILLAPTDIAAIKPDSFIGTAAAPQPDGTLKALEVHIFPPSMRGMGEGHTPWDLVPKSTMTNGSVGSIVGTNGRTLTVKYKDQQKQVFVPADVPVVNIEPGDQSMLTVGTKVVVSGVKGADGSLAARLVNVGKDGMAPPM